MPNIFHVTPSGAGSKDGSNWSNAFQGLPSTLVRDSIYYLAAGSYPGGVFGTPTSGTNTITIRKATEQEHGSDTGWQSSFSQQAVFTTLITFTTDYQILDGAVRNESQWNDQDSYGIRCLVSTAVSHVRYAIRVHADHIILNNIFMDGRTNSDLSKSIRVEGSHFHFDSCMLGYNHDDAIKFVAGGNGLIERNYIGPRISSSSGVHGDALEIRANSNIVFRYNMMNYAGDGLHFSIQGSYAENWDVYGNVFVNIPATGHRAIKVNSSSGGLGTIRVYNNTFHNLNGVLTDRQNTNFIFRNNLYSDIVVGSSSPSGDGNIEVSTDPFIDAGNLNFRLKESASEVIDQGIDLGDTYNIDPDGNIRGVGEGWDVGAYELATVDEEPPTTPQNLTQVSVGPEHASFEWTASSDNVGVHGYNIFRDDVLIGFTSSTSFTDSGLDMNTQYVYRVQAVDLSGNLSGVSSPLTITTEGPDEEPPSVPQNLQGEPTSAFRALLQWDPSTDNVEVSHYLVYRDGNQVGSSTLTSLVDTGLAPSTTYTYTVTAVDTSDNESDPSDSVQVTTPEGSPITDGLVAAYGFDEGEGNIAHDSSGNEHHGTIVTTSYTQTAQFGSALDFDGEDSRVNLGPIDVTGSEITLMAWVNPRSFAPMFKDNRIISKATGTAEQSHFWMLSTVDMDGQGVRFRFRVRANDLTTTLIPVGVESVVPLNEWTHVTAVFDGLNMTLFQNGNPIGTEQIFDDPDSPGVLNDDDVDVYIGANPPDLHSPWDGFLDEVRIYERALSQEEIQEAMITSIVPVVPSQMRQYVLRSFSGTSLLLRTKEAA